MVRDTFLNMDLIRIPLTLATLLLFSFWIQIHQCWDQKDVPNPECFLVENMQALPTILYMISDSYSCILKPFMLPRFHIIWNFNHFYRRTQWKQNLIKSTCPVTAAKSLHLKSVFVPETKFAIYASFFCKSYESWRSSQSGVWCLPTS